LIPNRITRLFERRAFAWAALFVAIVALRSGYLSARAPHWDESQYLEAGALHAAGGSAYEQRWFNYPPPLVLLMATAERGGWARGLILGWRAANLGAIAALAWLAAGRASSSGPGRTGVALLVASTPIVGHALEWGNLSPLIAALALIGFETERRRPWSSALTLGASVAVKPLAVGGAAFLSGHRLIAGPRRPGGAALLWPAVTALLLLPGAALLPEMLARMSGSYFDPHHLSLRRVLAGLGVDVPATWIAAAVVVGALLLAGRRPLAPREMGLVAPVVALLALPVVWAHTFVLTLPLQVAAAARLRERLRPRPEALAPGRKLAELAVVAAPVFAIQGASSPTLVNGWGATAQVVVCLLPALAPVALLAYVMRTGPPGTATAAPAGAVAA
jgi:hypothetical protein